MSLLAWLAIGVGAAAFLLIVAATVIAVREDAHDARMERQRRTFTDADIDAMTDAVVDAARKD